MINVHKSVVTRQNQAAYTRNKIYVHAVAELKTIFVNSTATNLD